ncbi:helix-turn-helix domain-containing protein [Nocardia brasiliensis]
MDPRRHPASDRHRGRRRDARHLPRTRPLPRHIHDADHAARHPAAARAVRPPRGTRHRRRPTRTSGSGGLRSPEPGRRRPDHAPAADRSARQAGGRRADPRSRRRPDLGGVRRGRRHQSPHPGAAVRRGNRNHLRPLAHQVRLAASLPLLAAGLPIARIAGRVGYTTPSAYVAAFRRAVGVSPGRYFTG